MHSCLPDAHAISFPGFCGAYSTSLRLDNRHVSAAAGSSVLENSDQMRSTTRVVSLRYSSGVGGLSFILALTTDRIIESQMLGISLTVLRRSASNLVIRFGISLQIAGGEMNIF